MLGSPVNGTHRQYSHCPRSEQHRIGELALGRCALRSSLSAARYSRAAVLRLRLRRGAGRCFERCGWHLFCGLMRAGSTPIARTAHRIRERSNANPTRGSIGQQAQALIGWRRACRNAALVIIQAQGKATRRGRLGLRQQRSSRRNSSRRVLEGKHSSRSRSSRTAIKGQQCSRIGVERWQCSRWRQNSSSAGDEGGRSAAERRRAACSGQDARCKARDGAGS